MSLFATRFGALPGPLWRLFDAPGLPNRRFPLMPRVNGRHARFLRKSDVWRSQLYLYAFQSAQPKVLSEEQTFQKHHVSYMFLCFTLFRPFLRQLFGSFLRSTNATTFGPENDPKRSPKRTTIATLLRTKNGYCKRSRIGFRWMDRNFVNNDLSCVFCRRFAVSVNRHPAAQSPLGPLARCSRRSSRRFWTVFVSSGTPKMSKNVFCL